jgi:hypothetical protein
MIIRKALISLLVLLIIITPACTSTVPKSAEMHFQPKLTMHDEGVLYFTLGITNEGTGDFSGMDDAGIQVVVEDTSGVVRNQLQLDSLEDIPAGESIFPLSYEAEYEPGRYTVTLKGKNISSLTIPFEIRKRGDDRILVVSPLYLDPYTELTLSEPDL